MKLSSFTCIEEIKKGWSCDKKFYVAKGDEEYLLRKTPIERLEKVKNSFELAGLFCFDNIQISKPITMNWDDNYVYSYYSWINGKELNEVINSFEASIQIDIGVDVGKQLSTIHSIKVTEENINKYYFKIDIDAVLNHYLNCGYKIENEKLILEFLRDKTFCLKNRPISLLHGDIHIGNIMIDESNEVYLIDFGNAKVDDPWQEFSGLTRVIEEYPHFFKGIIKGYFDDEVPNDFWPYFKYYAYLSRIRSLVWASSHSQDIAKEDIKRLKIIDSWYENIYDFHPMWNDNKQ